MLFVFYDIHFHISFLEYSLNLTGDVVYLSIPHVLSKLSFFKLHLWVYLNMYLMRPLIYLTFCWNVIGCLTSYTYRDMHWRWTWCNWSSTRYIRWILSDYHDGAGKLTFCMMYVSYRNCSLRKCTVFLFTAMSQVPSCKRGLLRCSLQHSVLSSNAWLAGCVLNLCSKRCFVIPSSAALFLMPSPTCPPLYLLMFYRPSLLDVFFPLPNRSIQLPCF